MRLSLDGSRLLGPCFLRKTRFVLLRGGDYGECGNARAGFRLAHPRQGADPSPASPLTRLGTLSRKGRGKKEGRVVLYAR